MHSALCMINPLSGHKLQPRRYINRCIYNQNTTLWRLLFSTHPQRAATHTCWQKLNASMAHMISSGDAVSTLNILVYAVVPSGLGLWRLLFSIHPHRACMDQVWGGRQKKNWWSLSGGSQIFFFAPRPPGQLTISLPCILNLSFSFHVAKEKQKEKSNGKRYHIPTLDPKRNAIKTKINGIWILNNKNYHRNHTPVI